jgi:hypothetical protein
LQGEAEVVAESVTGQDGTANLVIKKPDNFEDLNSDYESKNPLFELVAETPDNATIVQQEQVGNKLFSKKTGLRVELATDISIAKLGASLFFTKYLSHEQSARFLLSGQPCRPSIQLILHLPPL